ncbi:MAG: diphosphomevalonate decarboxylase [Anaerolineales bacterium]
MTIPSPEPRTALAHPNIAFIKYWGNRDEQLRLPASGSLSMNLGGLETVTTVQFDPSLAQDRFTLNGIDAQPAQLQRVSAFLDLVRQRAGMKMHAGVSSENNFPASAGIASSSSAFAALALAASSAAGLALQEIELSRLARRGSGSASRSVPGGFVEWQAAERDEDSFAVSVALPGHWDLVDCVAIVSETAKATGSSQGHQLAATSPLQAARLQGAADRLVLCRQAILQKDFDALSEVTELDCHLMHAVMMTSSPALLYWLPASLAVMQAVRSWRAIGSSACYTLDAGPNVHVICPAIEADRIVARLAELPGVIRVLRSGPGGPARLQD